tara:strand:- start:1147 stop:2325 length:1179 start_codon:yes stop_codon:yes gene_type:complete
MEKNPASLQKRPRPEVSVGNGTNPEGMDGRSSPQPMVVSPAAEGSMSSAVVVDGIRTPPAKRLKRKGGDEDSGEEEETTVTRREFIELKSHMQDLTTALNIVNERLDKMEESTNRCLSLLGSPDNLSKGEATPAGVTVAAEIKKLAAQVQAMEGHVRSSGLTPSETIDVQHHVKLVFLDPMCPMKLPKNSMELDTWLTKVMSGGAGTNRPVDWAKDRRYAVRSVAREEFRRQRDKWQKVLFGKQNYSEAVGCTLDELLAKTCTKYTGSSASKSTIKQRLAWWRKMARDFKAESADKDGKQRLFWDYVQDKHDQLVYSSSSTGSRVARTSLEVQASLKEVLLKEEEFDMMRTRAQQNGEKVDIVASSSTASSPSGSDSFPPASSVTAARSRGK